MRVCDDEGREAASGLCRSTPTAAAATPSPCRYHHEEEKEKLVVPVHVYRVW